MATKQVRMRWSWALDELAKEMARHFGYSDTTALVKGLLRYCARVDKSIGHDFSVPLSKEPPAIQDQIDALILKKWRKGEHIHRQRLEEMLREVAEEMGGHTSNMRQAKGRLAKALINEARDSGD